MSAKGDRRALIALGALVAAVMAWGVGFTLGRATAGSEPTVPLVGSTDPNANRWNDAGQSWHLTATLHPGEWPGSEWIAVTKLLGPTNGRGACTGQTRVTWEADGQVFAAVGDTSFAIEAADPWPGLEPAIVQEIPATEGVMVLSSCEVPAFANARGHRRGDGSVDGSAPTVTVAVEATTHEWSCLDERVATERSIAPDADCD